MLPSWICLSLMPRTTLASMSMAAMLTTFDEENAQFVRWLLDIKQEPVSDLNCARTMSQPSSQIESGKLLGVRLG